MQHEILTVKMRFTEPLLALSSGNREIQEEFIASKAPTQTMSEEEIAAIPLQTTIEKASTVFPRDELGLFMWDYQIKGMFKETLAVLIELGDLTTVTKWAIKGAVDNFIFINPRRIYLRKANGTVCQEPDGSLQRPLRADTMQGPRIALARSEQLLPGTTLEYSVKLLKITNPKSKKMLTSQNLKDALAYGAARGFGQWRSGGWGRHEVDVK